MVVVKNYIHANHGYHRTTVHNSTLIVSLLPHFTTHTHRSCQTFIHYLSCKCALHIFLIFYLSTGCHCNKNVCGHLAKDITRRNVENRQEIKNLVTRDDCVCACMWMCVLRFLPFPHTCACVYVQNPICTLLNTWLHACVCVCVCHVRRRSQVSVMCDDHYCHTPAPLPQLTLPMQMSLIASPRPSLLPNRLDDVHLLDLIKVMREGGMQEWRRKAEGGKTGKRGWKKLAQE